MGQKNYIDAEPMLLEGYDGMKTREAKIPAGGKHYIVEAATRLVRLYDALGQDEKAAQWRKVLEARKKT